ncbi:unnamed protein product [Kuraishia capsulata CBS 1993]|uniref:Dynactin subunit 2 n=1 Tax=Kuraishia capsulata CBS 1993 TaxID=1382522 RepID=W6MIT9_9ASCO|nr:uncharacterized protein KUCA_T00002386001 [Kuraishia capsulata CBS 1993]CDK26414.1 unnamed protein product [Kuraishia capsulata CBS 1993]
MNLAYNQMSANLYDDNEGEEAPEIYETSDVEEVDPGEPKEIPSQIIDTENVSIDNKQIYENHVVDSTGSDFGDSITKSRSGFRSLKLEETTKQKLIRIRNELSEISLDDSDNREVLEDVNDLKDVLKRLEQGHIESNFHPVFVRGHVNLEEDSPESQTEPKTAQYFTEKDIAIEIDSRIKNLEDSLGDTDIDSPNTIQGSLNDIYRRLNVLQSDDALHSVKEEIKSLNNQMTTFAHRARFESLRDQDSGPQDESTTKRIEAIYNSIQSNPDIGHTVDAILRRLRSLSKLQLDVSSSTSLLGQIASKIQLVEQDTAHWEQSLETMEKEIDGYSHESNENLRKVQAWIGDLETKLTKIGS